MSKTNTTNEDPNLVANNGQGKQSKYQQTSTLN